MNDIEETSQWVALCQTYLASLMLRPPGVGERVSPRDAPSPSWSAIFARIERDVLGGKVPDVFGHSLLPEVTALELDIYNHASASQGGSLASLESVAKRIAQYSASRRAATLSAALTRALLAADTASATELASSIIDVCRNNRDEVDQVLTVSEAMARGLETAQRESKESGGYRTGWPTLDNMYRLTPGSLLTIGAATNVGKSTVCTSWAWSLAAGGTSTAIISVEDPYEDFGVKLLAGAAFVDPSAIWRMELSGQEVERIGKVVSEAKVPLRFAYVMDRKLQTVLDRMELLASVHGCKVIMVDFLQAISGPTKSSKREEVDFILEALIAQAGRLKVALVVTSQLARVATAEDESGKARSPGITALKESGTIENRSQCVVLLHRESLTDTTIKVRLAKVIAAVNVR